MFNLWGPQTCAYATLRAKCGKFDVSQCFFQFCYRYLEIWHFIFVPHRMYTNHEGDSLFLPFFAIGISMYQISTLPYTLFLTYLPQAYSPLERSWQTDWQRKFFTPCSLSSFFTERVGPYPQAQLCWAGQTVGWMANWTRGYGGGNGTKATSHSDPNSARHAIPP